MHPEGVDQEGIRFLKLTNDGGVIDIYEAGVAPGVVRDLNLPGFDEWCHRCRVVRPRGTVSGHEEGEAHPCSLGEGNVFLHHGRTITIVDGERHEIPGSRQVADGAKRSSEAGQTSWREEIFGDNGNPRGGHHAGGQEVQELSAFHEQILGRNWSILSG